jgi:hypothetical protein
MGPETPAVWYSLRPGPLDQESEKPTSASEGEGWVLGQRRRGPAPPGWLVSPVPPHHIAEEIKLPGAMQQPSGGCLELTLPHDWPKRAPTPLERP